MDDLELMSEGQNLTTRQKALRINLDHKNYGTFAEIGAGQEVAEWFFKAGASSGTIAKTMSAYDMTISDAIYGPEASKRYVCEPRCIKMLSKEFTLLKQRLSDKRPDTNFFAFANTVEVINFKKTNRGQGWLGVRFQLTPGGKHNELIVHVWLKDSDKILQSQVIGIVGVNMIYACYYHSADPEKMLQSLMDNLSSDRIEIDMFRLTGPDFKEVDNRIFSLKLVKFGFTNATIFGPDGNVMQPADVLYKKNILALRGRFRPVTHVNTDMVRCGRDMFINEPDVEPDKILILSELTLANLRGQAGEIDERDFLDRVDILCSLGQHVMISNYHEYYRLIDYLSRFTRGKKIGVVLGVFNLMDVFQEKFYTNLNGGILEAFGKLFGQNVKMYVYPAVMPGTTDMMTCQNFQTPKHLEDLYKYLLSNMRLADIKTYNKNTLHIFSDNVLSLISQGTKGWEKLVPREVEKAIKEKCLFGYPCTPQELKKAKKE